MFYDVIMTGFGGQGIQTISLMVAIAAINKDLRVTYLPSYGVEKRGGRTDVTVIVSDEEIGSPITNTPRALIAMDSIGLEFYRPMLGEGSLLVANASLIPEEKIKAGKGIDIISERFNEEAVSLGNPKLANMIMLGSFIGRSGLLGFDDMEAIIKEVIPERLHETIHDNMKALERGIAISKNL